jgi:hypothetical protein
MQALCKKPELAAYFNKSPCSTNQMTAEHLTDQTKATPAEKIALDQASQSFGQFI